MGKTASALALMSLVLLVQGCANRHGDPFPWEAVGIVMQEGANYTARKADNLANPQIRPYQPVTPPNPNQYTPQRSDQRSSNCYQNAFAQMVCN